MGVQPGLEGGVDRVVGRLARVDAFNQVVFDWHLVARGDDAYSPGLPLGWRVGHAGVSRWVDPVLWPGGSAALVRAFAPVLAEPSERASASRSRFSSWSVQMAVWLAEQPAQGPGPGP